MARFAARVASAAFAATIVAAVAAPIAANGQGPKPLDMTVIEATPGMQDLPFLAMKLVADKAQSQDRGHRISPLRFRLAVWPRSTRSRA